MTTSAQLTSARGSSLALAVAVTCALLIVASAVLWAYFGTAVFFEVIAAGLAYCF